MTWNLIRLSEAPAAPWRNGGGVTHELAAWPANEADWAWRISVADVTVDGPFSHFPGVQRWFAVVHGAGVRLSIAGEVHEVAGTSAPIEFDGAASVESELVAGPTQDLNLMVHRERASGVMTRVDAQRRITAAADGVVAVFALDAPVSVHLQHSGSRIDVPPYSLAWGEVRGGTAVEIAASGAICMEITLRS